MNKKGEFFFITFLKIVTKNYYPGFPTINDYSDRIWNNTIFYDFTMINQESYMIQSTVSREQ